LLNMEHPLLILIVGRIEIWAYPEARIQNFHVQNPGQLEVPKTRLAPCACKAHGLPANKHNDVLWCAANAIRVNDPRDWLTLKGNSTGLTLLGRLP